MHTEETGCSFWHLHYFEDKKLFQIPGKLKINIFWKHFEHFKAHFHAQFKGFSTCICEETVSYTTLTLELWYREKSV